MRTLPQNLPSWQRKMALIVAAFLAPFFVSTFYSAWQDVRTAGPHLHCDEAFVFEPTMKVYKHGYWGYRCWEDLTAACYGGTQALLDTLTLKAFPSSVVEKSPLVLGPGHHWPWLAKYPRALKILRYSRFFYALTLLMLVAWWARGLTGPLQLLLMVALGTSPVFFSAWQALKNDYPSVLWGSLFFAASYSWILKPSLRFFLVSNLLGIVAICARPAFLAPYLLNFLLYGAFLFQKRTAMSTVIRHYAWGIIVSALTYLFLNPNYVASGEEAKWILHFFHISGNVLQPLLVMKELWVSRETWGLFMICTLLLWQVYKQEPSRKTLFQNFSVLLLITSVFAPVFKITQQREHYYLPTLCFEILTIIFTLRRLRKTPSWLTPSLAIFLLLTHTPWPLKLPQSHFTFSLVSRNAEFENIQNQMRTDLKTKWFVDAAVRFPVPQEASSRVMFFDSLSMAPSEILKSSQTENIKIIVGCWHSTPLNDQTLLPESQSPSADQWAHLTKELCAKTTPLNEHALNSYARYARNFFYVVTDKAMLEHKSGLLKLPIPPRFYDRELHPRVLQGSLNGMDHWPWPFQINESFKLENTFTVTQRLHSVTLDSFSNCRSPSTLSLHVGSQQTKISINTHENFCQDYRHLCAIAPRQLLHWFERWSQRPYPQKTLKLSLDLPPGSTMTLKVEGQLSESCLVALKNLKFK